MRPDEGVLGDLLGVRVIAEMSERYGEHPVAIARNDLGERPLVPGLEVANELGVERGFAPRDARSAILVGRTVRNPRLSVKLQCWSYHCGRNTTLKAPGS